ncbi:MAG TPA: YbhN family protein [Acidimicrobiales bacterium]|nr:YbhN family protein [Acidimicrobiales bacterium]
MTASWRGPSGRRVWRVVRPFLLVAVLAVAGDVVFGRSGELSGAGAYLGRADLVWMLAAAGAEILSMVCFALAERRILREGHAHLRLRPLFGIALAGNAITNSLPAGPAFGALYAYRQFRDRGVGEVVAAWSLIGMNVLASAALAVLAAVGVTAAIGQGTALDLVGVTMGTLVAAAGAIALLRRPDVLAVGLRGLFRAGRTLVRRPAEPALLAERIRRRLAVVRPGWPGLAIAFGWAAGNWLLDLACLIAAFGAVDAPVPWRGLLLAYGAAQLAANLPITPGGLGVVEGSLTIGLVAYGGSEPSTVAAVLLYRLVSFWGLVVLGWVVAGGLALAARRDEALRPPVAEPVAVGVPAISTGPDQAGTTS